MNSYKLTSILSFCCLVALVVNASAQQPATRKSQAPRLTSDDVVRGRTTGAVVVLNAVDENKWTRHNLAALNLALELPGGITPRESALPNHALNVSLSDYPNAALYVGASTTLQLDLLHIPGKKLNPGQAELRKAAAVLVKAFATKMDPKAVYSTHLTNPSTVTVKATMIGTGGATFEMMGKMQSKGTEMWFVASVFRQSDEQSRKVAQRIANSVTLN